MSGNIGNKTRGFLMRVHGEAEFGAGDDICLGSLCFESHIPDIRVQLIPEDIDISEVRNSNSLVKLTLQAQGLPQEFARTSGDRNDKGWSFQRLNKGHSPGLPSKKPFGAMFVREATQGTGRSKHCIGMTFGADGPAPLNVLRERIGDDITKL
jgi:hypothetical protein